MGLGPTFCGFLLLGLPMVGFAIWGVVFCLDFGSFFFLLFFPCWMFFLYLFIYLFNLFSNSPSSGNVGKSLRPWALLL
jgi:hypothetical protein